MKTEKLLKNIAEGKTVFLKYDFENVVLKIEAGNKCFVKFENETEYRIYENAELVFTIQNEGVEITEKEYKEF